ncbi:MAG: PepSY domain-containing protein, partial [Steroidobacteraceae bacterium]
AFAAGGRSDRDRDERALAERAISLDEAVARAERRYQARAVKAEEKRHGDRIEYRIRLLGEDGRVFEVRVDAASGREE